MGDSTIRTCLVLSSSITMKSLVLVLPALVACVASDTASIRGLVPNFLVSGQCPVVNEKALWAEQKPNHPKYGGRWFEVARSKNPFQLVKQCTKSDLTYNGAGFDHITSGLDQNGLPTRREGTTFEFTTGANRQTPHLSIQFEQPSFAAPYVILDTDYDGDLVSDFLFVWSRSPAMETQHFDRCLVAFRKAGLDVNRLEKVTQGSDCDYEGQDGLLF